MYETWNNPPQELLLSEGEVHIWCASLALLANCQEQFWNALSSDERERADRFRFELHRQHFVVGRGVLRKLLGRYLHIAPESIAFSYLTNGKPLLVPPTGTASIEFNISHSQELALYAFTRGQAIGVDIEYMREFTDTHAIVNSFFSQREQQVFHSLPHSQQTTAFFAGWTRKEAYLKACGAGLSLPLSQFEVSLRPDEAAHILAVGGDKNEARHWFLQDLSPPIPGYRAAFVLKGRRPTRISQWLYER